MAEQTFRPGELVDITIRGARVVEPRHSQDTALTVAYAEPQPGIYAMLRIEHPDAKTVNVERQAPAEWPPLAGDLWRDRDGALWFAVGEPVRGDDYGPLAGAYIAMKASDPTPYAGHNPPGRAAARVRPADAGAPRARARRRRGGLSTWPP